MIALTCVDALNYYPSIRAIESTIKAVPISRIYWFSDESLESKVELDIPITWIKIQRFKKFTDELNFIMLKLVPHVVTEQYNIIVQADGFAVNKKAWTDEFLKYDYIGARWSDGEIGNGGFSLRSRKLYDAMLDLNIKTSTSDYPPEIINHPKCRAFDTYFPNEQVLPEDVIICRVYRKTLEKSYGIKFAEGDIVEQFSIEDNSSSMWLGRGLGFHGKHGISKYYGVTL